MDEESKHIGEAELTCSRTCPALQPSRPTRLTASRTASNPPLANALLTPSSGSIPITFSSPLIVSPGTTPEISCTAGSDSTATNLNTHSTSP